MLQPHRPLALSASLVASSTLADGSRVATSALFGAACWVLVGALIFIALRVTDRTARRTYLIFAAFLAASALSHLREAFPSGNARAPVDALLSAVALSAAVAAVLLVTRLTRRAASLAHERRSAQDREREFATVYDQLAGAYSRLRELSEMKTHAFTNVSHELRTPLTLILGPVKKLLDAENLLDSQRASLAIVERNAQLLLGHVTDLLELSRVDSQAIEIDRRPTDVGQLARALASNFRELARDLGVEYEVDVPRLPVSLLLDARKVERVGTNLLANAFKFTPRGGRVVFRVRVDLGEEGRPTQLLLTVDDSGPGIRPEDRELVFGRFQQLDAKPNRAFPGTGLGLAIVREFVAASGGSVSIEDSNEGGARFIVRLPVDESIEGLDPDRDPLPSSGNSAEMLALQPRPQDSPRTSPGADLPLVLVVEDNPDMNRFVCSSLMDEFQVAAAFDGRQALTRLDTLTPDLVITDYMMPRMSGEEFVRSMRERPGLADVPVLVLTARDDTELRVRLLSEGAQDWLAKPFTLPELVARARNLVSARRARDVLRSELTSRETDVGSLAVQLAERKRHLETLLQSLTVALEHAEHASRFKTSLLRLVSHELRTPLGPLQLQVDRLSSGRQGSLNDEQKHIVERIQRSLRRLSETIQSLLEYARIESGHLELRVESFDARELAQNVVDDFSPQAEGKGLRLALDAPPTVLPFDSDPRLVRLILVNLIGNSLRFTETGEIVVQVSVADDECVLTVRDTGPGIDPNLKTSIFEPFFQIDTTGRDATGVGLGLSLVREMLAAVGGRVELESEVGVGSTFRITVPRADDSRINVRLGDDAQRSA